MNNNLKEMEKQQLTTTEPCINTSHTYQHICFNSKTNQSILDRMCKIKQKPDGEH